MWFKSSSQDFMDSPQPTQVSTLTSTHQLAGSTLGSRDVTVYSFLGSKETKTNSCLQLSRTGSQLKNSCNNTLGLF